MGNLELFSRDLVLCNLGSGSRGNATFVGSAGRGVLVDLGLPVKEALRRLEARGIPESAVEGVVVTHEHGDHAHAVRRFAASRGIAVRANPATAEAAGLADLPGYAPFRTGERFTAAGLGFDPVPIPHDTADPVAFVVDNGRDRLAIATDLGAPTRTVVERLSGCRLVMLEFNHDLDMLMSGPYPWHLKERVRGRHGHLSNRQALDVLEGIARGPLERVLLAHLSEHNNTPHLAYGEAAEKLRALGRADVALDVLEQREPGRVYRIDDRGIRVEERY